MNISPRVLKLCAWSGPLLAAMMLTGMLLAHMIPWGAQPHSTASASDIEAFYAAHLTEIRVGCLLCILSQALYIPFGTLIALHTRRMEPGFPIFSLMQLVAVGACTAIAAPFGVFWALAAFRVGDAGASAEVVRLFNDAGWLFFIIPLPVFTLWFALIAVPIGSRHNDESVFPRWTAYLNWLEVFGLLPVFLVIFFKEGAFGWSGALAFYFPLAVFCIWFFAMSMLLVRSANAAPPLVVGAPASERERELDEVYVPPGAAGVAS